MHDTTPFTPKRHDHTDSIRAGLKSMAERLLKERQSVPLWCDARRVVYGNFCDVVSWEEVNALYERAAAKRAAQN